MIIKKSILTSMLLGFLFVLTNRAVAIEYDSKGMVVNPGGVPPLKSDAKPALKTKEHTIEQTGNELLDELGPEVKALVAQANKVGLKENADAMETSYRNARDGCLKPETSKEVCLGFIKSVEKSKDDYLLAYISLLQGDAPAPEAKPSERVLVPGTAEKGTAPVAPVTCKGVASPGGKQE